MEKKIKIDVITLHAVQNYGSVLQALATQEILKQHGCDVTIIDYENLVKKWSGGNPIKALAIIPTILRWKNVFQSFAKKYLDLSEKHIQRRMTLKVIPWMQMRIVLEATKYGIQNGIMGFCHVYI